MPPPQTQVEEPPMALASETAAAAVIVEATSVEVEHEVPQQEEATQPPPPPPPPPPPSETPVEAAFVHIEESLNKSVENVEDEVARSVGNMHERGDMQGGPAPAAQDLSDLYLSALNITAPDAPTLLPATPVLPPAASTAALTVVPTVAPAEPALAAERAEAPAPILGAVANIEARRYMSNLDWVGGHIRPEFFEFWYALGTP